VSHYSLGGWQTWRQRPDVDDTVKDNTSNGLKLIGEVVVPGASQFVDGHIKSGSIHLLGALASMAPGGPAACSSRR
jgi:hypothetical protein